ncbi:MAG: tRNA lysidine(34) synthetase TilS [Bacteroidota bacterium]
MIKKLEKHISDSFAFIKNKKILIGLSGGLDSIVLAYLLNELGFEILLAHVNFKLRGKDSDEDENFVVQWAQNFEIPLFKTSFDTRKVASKRKISIEMAARDLRYDWFKELSKQNNFDYIAVAHHLNDNIETILMNLSRGTGITGISGMKDISGNIIRPLLPFSRNEIEQYANENNLQWREDLSNLDTIYKRNKIRHELIPLFEELNPSFVDSFSKNIDNFRQTEKIQNEYLNNLNCDFWSERDDIVEISIPKLKKHIAYKTILREKLLPFNFRNIDDILHSFSSISGKMFFSETHRIIKDRDTLILRRIENVEPEEFIIEENISSINIPIRLNFKTSEIFSKNHDKQIAQLDKSKLKFPLKIRKWKTGDFFYPQGLKGKKKISKFYKDEKYSLLDKEEQWLLVSGEDIVWVIGKRIDERYKVDSNTKEVLHILSN